jgi:holo-[acyl-carrier protein] synthase
MIIGIGCDIISISRIAKILTKYNCKFLNRIYTAKEINRAPSIGVPRYYAYFAKRFAAKEAYAKATKLGIGGDITFSSIEILNDANNAPYFNYHPFANKEINTFLSLSDENSYAIAYVVLLKTKF